MKVLLRSWTVTTNDSIKNLNNYFLSLNWVYLQYKKQSSWVPWISSHTLYTFGTHLSLLVIRTNIMHVHYAMITTYVHWSTIRESVYIYLIVFRFCTKIGIFQTYTSLDIIACTVYPETSLFRYIFILRINKICFELQNSNWKFFSLQHYNIYFKAQKFQFFQNPNEIEDE